MGMRALSYTQEICHPGIMTTHSSLMIQPKIFGTRTLGVLSLDGVNCVKRPALRHRQSA